MAIRKSSISGVPFGETTGRPSSPVIGTTYYNGQKGYLEIYNGSAWIIASAVPGSPTISVANVGTNMEYGSAQANVTITAPTNGGPISNYVIVATNDASSYTATSTSATTVNMIVGNGGTYNISAYANNDFGNSQSSAPLLPSLSTKPSTPVISVTSSDASSITYAVSVNTGNSTITNWQYSTDGTTYTALSPAITSTTSVTVTGLSSATSYTIRLKAVNANGASSASNAVTYATAWSLDYVAVGGGAGAGGYYYTGGGGSGGMATGSVTGLTGVSYRVTVGAGGAQQNGPGGSGNPGSNSQFSTIIAYGGMGQTVSNTATHAGGLQATALAGGGQGGNGADSTASAGGGGGAGAAGSPGASNGSLTGNGGIGLTTSISGSSVYYGGGGGGSTYANGSRGTGGSGGGGNGCKGSDPSNAPGSAGTANTGGGGGGASHPYNGADRGYGYAGGSGIVIIKIPNSFTGTFSAGVTQTMSTAVSGYKVYRITAAGTTDTVTFS